MFIYVHTVTQSTGLPQLQLRMVWKRSNVSHKRHSSTSAEAFLWSSPYQSSPIKCLKGSVNTSMKDVPYCEAQSCWTRRQIPHLLWNQKFCYTTHKSPTLFPTLSQLKPVHTVTSFLYWYQLDTQFFYINYIKLSSSTCFERHPLILRRSMILTVHVYNCTCIQLTL